LAHRLRQVADRRLVGEVGDKEMKIAVLRRSAADLFW